MGDYLYWGAQPSYNYRKASDESGKFYQQIFSCNAFTDVVVMGSQRDIHTKIYPIAKENNATIHVFEEGYLRPSWVTLERDGVNGYSQLPKEADWYRDAAKLIPDYKDGKLVSNPIRMLALHEIAYHLPNILNFLFYPGYRTHRQAISGLEFAGWARRFARMPIWERQDKHNIEELISSQRDFYVLPLQLDFDSQIIHHSPFSNMIEVIDKVTSSFAQFAPSTSTLVIKNHPLDTGFVNYRKAIKSLRKTKIAGWTHPVPGKWSLTNAAQIDKGRYYHQQYRRHIITDSQQANYHLRYSNLRYARSDLPGRPGSILAACN